jgi:hypothetical protein
MKYFKIKDNKTLDLFIVNSDEQPENSVLVTDDNSNFIMPKANDIVFTEVIEGATEKDMEDLRDLEVPLKAKNMKFRLALIQEGISVNSISQYIDSMPHSTEKEQMQTLWEYADFFERKDQVLINMAKQFKIKSSKLNQIFIIANNL